MTTYFQAAKAVRVFTEYKRLTTAYWEAQPPDHRSRMARDCPAPENDASSALRQQIIYLYPEANTCAASLGVPVTARSYPAPAVGGPVIPVNRLFAVVDRDQGHARLSQQTIMDAIDGCLAQAIAVKKRLFLRQLINPVWWLSEIAAYILRIPFLILRSAGVPAAVEESIWGHIVKVSALVVLILIGLHYGLNLSPKDILNFLK